MPSVYDPDNFTGRVEYAASRIVRGGSIGSRRFDACFALGGLSLLVDEAKYI